MGARLPQILTRLTVGAQASRSLRYQRWTAMASLQQALRAGDARRISAAFTRIWETASTKGYYDRYAARFEGWFFGPHQGILPEIMALSRTARFQQMIEIGCGDGQALGHLAPRLPDIPRLTGVDVNRAIITRNAQAPLPDPRLGFVCADAPDWLAGAATPGTLLYANGGVLEYLSRFEVVQMFADLAGKPGSAVALVEPVDFCHDLNRDTASHVFGVENAFSHNYPALLARAGFKMRYRNELYIDGIRWMLLVTEPIC